MHFKSPEFLESSTFDILYIASVTNDNDPKIVKYSSKLVHVGIICINLDTIAQLSVVIAFSDEF